MGDVPLLKLSNPFEPRDVFVSDILGRECELEQVGNDKLSTLCIVGGHVDGTILRNTGAT